MITLFGPKQRIDATVVAALRFVELVTSHQRFKLRKGGTVAMATIEGTLNQSIAYSSDTVSLFDLGFGYLAVVTSNCTDADWQGMVDCLPGDITYDAGHSVFVGDLELIYMPDPPRKTF